MGLDKLTDLAQQLAGKDQPAKGQQQDSSLVTSGREWASVGSAAKDAFADFQTSQAAGKTSDYREIGGVAQKAFSAYNNTAGGNSSCSEKQTLTELGKGIAAGFNGSRADERVGETGEVEKVAERHREQT
ncbi:hypothetical protein EsH8_I_000953 [Colletotrichum jinshuiense]